MFTKKITESDAFLDMPLSTQALYFHLNMGADDEGFVNNAKRIQRNIGASDDDLRLLFIKRFILPFESGVIVIKHWKMHNYIAKDRFHKSQYEEERDLLEVKENGAYTLKNEIPYTECIQDVYADKNSIDKNSIESINTLSSKNSVDYQKIIELYHKNCPSLPKVSKITDARKKLINARLKDYSEEELEAVFKESEESDFLTGRNGKWGGANFDWIMNTNNIVKIYEGNYRNKTDYKTENQRVSQQNNYKNGSNPDFIAMLEAETKNKGQFK